MNMINILLVDNHSKVLEQVEIRLSREADLCVCAVSDLSSFERELIKCDPCVLVIDPIFKNVLNIKALITAREMFPNLIVVVLTAIVDTSQKIALNRVGVNCIVQKGGEPDRLANKIRELASEGIVYL